MKRYMIVFVADGEQGAAFFDKFKEAEDFRFNTVCGMGGEAEMYERTEIREDINGIKTVVSHEYQLVYA